MSIYDRDQPPSPDPDLEPTPEPEIESSSTEEPYADEPLSEQPVIDAFAEPEEPSDAERGGTSLMLKLLAVPLLVAICVPTLFLGLGRSSLWEPDEPRMAEASQTMMVSGDYLTPTFNGEPRFEESILSYWLQALSFRFLGVSEYTARMPAALAGLACVLLVYLIGLRLFSARAALLGAITLATTFRFVVHSRSGVADVPVLFLTLVALYGFIRASEMPPPGGRFAVLAWIAIGLGVLTKGLFGLMPLAVWIVYLILTGRLGGLLRLRFSTGVLVAIVIAAPWYLYMAWAHGRTFVEFALFSEVLTRYASPDVTGQARDALYYLTAWPGDAAPWTLYIVAAVALALFGGRAIEPEQRRGTTLCVIWFLAVLALCSLSEFKLPQHLLPLYPATALIVGFLFDRAADELDGARPWFALSSWLTALGFLGLAGFGGWFLQRTFETSLVSFGMVLPAALAVAGVFIAIFQRGARPLWVFGTIAPVVAFGYAFLMVDTIPRELEPFKPVRPLARIMATQVDPEGRIGLYHDASPGFVFYSGQNVEWLHTADQVNAFLSEDGLRLCVMPADDLESVRSGYSGTLYKIASRPRRDIRFADVLRNATPVDESALIVISNRRPLSAED